MDPTVSEKIEVNASPGRVYELITDLRSLAGLAEETVSCTLLGGATAVEVGARFRGAQKRGLRRWTTVSTVTDVEPGERFAFNVKSVGIPVSRWLYEITTTPGGCVVTESTWDRRPKWFEIVSRVATGVTDRATVNRHNITATLERLKAKAEKA
ncbi:MAG: SRPBCC family protein [Kibdelosporangium sp.]